MPYRRRQQEEFQTAARLRGDKTTTTAGRGLLDVVADGLRDETKPWHRSVEWAEARAGVDRLKLFVGAACVLAAYLSTSGPGTVLAGDAVAFLYPAYATVAAVVAPDDDDVDRPGPKASEAAAAAASRRQWLAYWTTLVAVLVAERLLGGLLLFVVPYYALLRCVFFVWCYAPGSRVNGAELVNEAVVRRLWADRGPGNRAA